MGSHIKFSSWLVWEHNHQHIYMYWPPITDCIIYQHKRNRLSLLCSAAVDIPFRRLLGHTSHKPSEIRWLWWILITCRRGFGWFVGRVDQSTTATPSSSSSPCIPAVISLYSVLSSLSLIIIIYKPTFPICNRIWIKKKKIKKNPKDYASSYCRIQMMFRIIIYNRPQFWLNFRSSL